MGTALWITLIGMGLVFLAIVLLWGLMALLVRLTAEKTSLVPAPASLAVEAETSLEALPVSEQKELEGLRERAAAAAVAFAMAQRAHSRADTLPPPASQSNWQTVQRAGQLAQRSASHRKVNR